jgi:hypothetical protein
MAMTGALPDGADKLDQRLQECIRCVADALEGLTPYERAIVLHAETVRWEKCLALIPDEALQQESRDLRLALIAQWLGAVVHRMSEESLVTLLTIVERLDEDDKLERLVGEDGDPR